MPPISTIFTGPSPFSIGFFPHGSLTNMQKAEVIREFVLKLCYRQTNKQTNRQTDTQDYKVSEQKQTLPHICVGREQLKSRYYVNAKIIIIITCCKVLNKVLF